MRRTYTVAPYGVDVVFTDETRVFNRITESSRVDAYTHGACWRTKTGYVVGIFDRNWLTAVHECTHLAMFVLAVVGIDPASNNSEPLAFLVDNLTAVCCKLLGLR